ncbi:MAG: RNA polymerase sigma factor [Bacteroidales bacterium]|nr:RNA polymerase sigma factor [Bacteroidales bacterium]
MIDNKLTESVRMGDRNAFSRVLDITIGSMLLTAVRIVGNHEDAEDIVQDAYLKVWEKRDDIKSGGSLSGWIRTIVVNRCYDHLRREKVKGSSLPEGQERILVSIMSDDRADGEIEYNEFREILQAVTALLSPVQRIVFVLSEIEGMDNGEISTVTALSSSVVKSNLWHARKKVKSLLKGIYNKYEKL